MTDYKPGDRVVFHDRNPEDEWEVKGVWNVLGLCLLDLCCVKGIAADYYGVGKLPCVTHAYRVHHVEDAR